MVALRFHPVLAFRTARRGAVPSNIVLTAMRRLSKSATGKATRPDRIRPRWNGFPLPIPF
jgi:hypothetical protein